VSNYVTDNSGGLECPRADHGGKGKVSLTTRGTGVATARIGRRATTTSGTRSPRRARSATSARQRRAAARVAEPTEEARPSHASWWAWQSPNLFAVDEGSAMEDLELQFSRGSGPGPNSILEADAEELTRLICKRRRSRSDVHRTQRLPDTGRGRTHALGRVLSAPVTPPPHARAD